MNPEDNMCYFTEMMEKLEETPEEKISRLERENARLRRYEFQEEVYGECGHCNVRDYLIASTWPDEPNLCKRCFDAENERQRNYQTNSFEAILIAICTFILTNMKWLSRVFAVSVVLFILMSTVVYIVNLCSSFGITF